MHTRSTPSSSASRKAPVWLAAEFLRRGGAARVSATRAAALALDPARDGNPGVAEAEDEHALVEERKGGSRII